MGNVVVTGAAHGIGAALVGCFAQRGHAVAVLDIDADAAATRAKQLQEQGGGALSIGCDVTRASECSDAISQVIETWGGIDILVNNAGITHVGLVRDTDPDVLRRVMDVNFFGAVHCTQAALPSLLERKGRVAVLSSVAGFAPLATRAGYVASKHAVQGFFETLRTEHAAEGLTVTIACPSFVETGIGTRALGADGRAAGEDARTGVAHAVGPDEAARRIVEGVEHRDRIVWVGHEARRAWWVNALAPRLYERLMLGRTR